MTDPIPVERMGDSAPKEIVELLQLPYKFFSSLLRPDIHGGILMDIASGEAQQRDMLLEHFDEVKSYDYSFKSDVVKFADIRAIPEKNNSIDDTFCFETIEHLDYDDQIRALKELKRVTAPEGHVVIGSVDAFGHDYIGEHIIFKRTGNNMNPFHKRELDSITFPNLIEEVFDDVLYTQSHHNPEGKLVMRYGLSTRPKAFNNYAICRL